jgi:hypothetical protein
VRKLIGALALLAACHHSQPSTAPTNSAPVASGSTSGAADPVSAVRTYLAAVKAQDLQAMSLVWGTAQGPARAQMDRDYLEKAELVVVRCLAHDSYDVIGDAPGIAGKRVFAVALKRRDLTKTTNFNVVSGPSRRWYVESVDMEPLQQFCSNR